MEVHTDQPGMQVYTSNQLAPVKGKRDAAYGKYSAICMETQKFPNAIHIVSNLRKLLGNITGALLEHILFFS